MWARYDSSFTTAQHSTCPFLFPCKLHFLPPTLQFQFQEVLCHLLLNSTSKLNQSSHHSIQRLHGKPRNTNTLQASLRSLSSVGSLDGMYGADQELQTAPGVNDYINPGYQNERKEGFRSKVGCCSVASMAVSKQMLDLGTLELDLVAFCAQGPQKYEKGVHRVLLPEAAVLGQVNVGSAQGKGARFLWNGGRGTCDKNLGLHGKYNANSFHSQFSKPQKQLIIDQAFVLKQALVGMVWHPVFFYLIVIQLYATQKVLWRSICSAAIPNLSACLRG
eukprot:445504-Pelagomonas_calceolata.AAC.6